MKKKLLFISLVLIFGLIFSGAVSATDIYVNTTGNDATGTGTIDNPYLTVSRGVSTVSTGGTIYIADGIYNRTGDRGITISRNMNFQGQSEAGTIIDAQQLSRIFTIQSSVTVNIFDLTLRNGNSTTLQAGCIENNGQLTLDGCTFTGNNAPNAGAIYNGGILTVNDCTFTGNTASMVDGNGGAISNAGSLDVTGSSFTGNGANCGAAIFNDDSRTAVIDDSSFTGNNANNGGAIYNNMGEITSDNNNFINNIVTSYGGAIYNSGTLTVTGNTFTSNTAESGGAIFSYYSSTLTVNDSTFINNHAIYTDMGVGGAICAASGTINYSAFFGNTAEEGNAIYAFDQEIDATKNWWGSNADPAGDISGWVNYNPWIVMSISASPTIISPGETSTVTVDFNHVNGGGPLTGGFIPNGLSVLFVSDYKGSVNPAIVLTLNGIVTTTYTAGFIEGGYSIVNAILHGQTVNTTITIPNPVDLIPSNLVVPSTAYTLHDYKVYVDVTNDGDDATPNGFHIILQDNGTTVDEIWIAGLNAKTTLYNLEFSWTPTGPGPHFLEILVDPYSEVIEFNETNNAINATRNVFTKTALIFVDQVSGYTGDVVDLTATLMDTAYGTPISGKNVKFTVNGVFVDSAVTDENGIASLPYLITFYPGTYPIFAEFLQDDLYIGSTDTDNLTVNFTPTNITVNTVEGYWNDTINIIATLTDTGHNTPLQNKEVHFTVDGNDIGSAFTNEYGIATIPYQIPLNTGNYPIVVTFNQDLIYLGTTNTTTLKVKSTPTNITVTPAEGYWNDTINIIATLTDTAPGHQNKPLEGKEIKFYINGTYINTATTNTNGIATLPYTIPLNTGTYQIIAEFLTNQIYTGTTNNTTLTVKSTPTNITVTPAEGYWNDTINIIATLTDTAPGHQNKPLEGKEIKFYINGTYINTATTNTNGIATLPYTIPLNTGTYQIIAEFLTNQIYTGTTNNTTLTVKSTPTNITVTPAEGYWNDTINIIATLTDTAPGHQNKPLEGKEIKFYINGTYINTATTNTNGIATLPYTIPLNTGTYNILIEFLTNNIYTGTTNNTTLTVKSTPTNITITPVSGYNNDNVTLTATLTDIASGHQNKPLKGKQIDFYVNSAYVGTAITNTAGIANIGYIINLSAGNFIIYAEYSGDSIYGTSNGNNNLTVFLNITNLNPVNGTITPYSYQVMIITFNGQIQEGSVYETISVKDALGNTQTLNKSINGNQLIITPVNNYADGTYALNIPTNSIADLAGNLLQNPFTSTFTVDTQPPLITSVTPTNGATINNTNQIITITFNENIQPGTTYNNIVLWNDYVNREKPSTKTINGNQLIITPITPLYNANIYTIIIPTNSIADLAGNLLQNPFTSTFTVDTRPPLITSVTPTNGATINNTNQIITITFNENIQPGTTYNNIVLWNDYVNREKPSTKTINGNQLIITPITPLYNANIYTIIIPTNSIADLAGNLLQNPFTSTFTVDTRPPLITSVTPTNGATINNTNQIITITFNENIQPGTTYNNISVKNAQGIIQSINKNINGNQLTITKIGGYTDGGYTLHIPVNALADLAGNLLQNPFTSTFTVDTQPPLITSVTPTNGATINNTNQIITITFNENIQPGTTYNNIVLWNDYVNREKPSTKTINGNQLIITPITPLYNANIYTIIIPTNSIADLAGNLLQNPFTSTFTVDTRPPLITSVTPTNGATINNTNQIITITFNENIQPGTTYNNISVKNAQGIIQSINKNINGNQLTITKIGGYTDGGYTLHIPVNALADLAGNLLQNPFTSTFTVDTRPPLITSVTPTNGATINNTNQIITITFNENIQPGTTYNNIVLWNDYVNREKPSTKTINGNQLIITPITPLYNANIYTIIIPTNSIADLAGNLLQNPFTSTFTVDTRPPLITSVTPTNGATINNTNQIITITFNENIQPGTTYNNIVLWNDYVNREKPSTKTINGNQLIITPITPLYNANIYTIIIPTNSIADLAGNLLQNPFTSTFTVDTQPPLITSVTPTNGATINNTNQIITITFNENIQPGTTYNNIVLWNDYVNREKPSTKTINGNQLIITPITPLYNANIYTIIIPTNSIADLAGNLLQNPFTSTFTIDTQPPLITSVTPTNGATINNTNQIITITFNENIQPGTTYNNIVLWNDYVNREKPSTKTINGNQLIITPITPLYNANIYTIIIPTNSIADLAGNLLQNPFTSTFTIDTQPPLITSVTPTNGTTALEI